MKQKFKILGKIAAIIVVPGVLAVFIALWIAKLLGFKFNFKGLKDRIMKKK